MFSNRSASALLPALILASAGLLLYLGNTSHAAKPVKCTPWPACKDDGGDTGSAADPAFAYVRPANGSPKVILANADGSNATEIFVGLKFTIAQEPAAFRDMSGGKVLIGDFSNLFLVSYSVSGGAINVDPEVMIHSRDIVSAHSANPDWSPDGEDFAFRTSLGRMYIDSRAARDDPMNPVVVTDFGPLLYQDDRPGTTHAGVKSIAWDSDNIIHFIAQNPGGGTELRSLDIRDCDPTCDSVTTTCIASNGSLSCDGAEELPGLSTRGHVSVNYDTSCSAGDGPHILVSGNDANGDPITFVLDRSPEEAMFTMEIQNLDGNDWTDRCTFVGSPGENSEGPLHGGAIVEYDPFIGNTTITLINRRGQTPDWNN